jgi:hypothetical protein
MCKATSMTGNWYMPDFDETASPVHEGGVVGHVVLQGYNAGRPKNRPLSLLPMDVLT